jgi:hypothetical protein
LPPHYRVIDWLKAFAKNHNLTWKQDDFGNLVIFRPGSGGGEKAPAVIIQVCAASIYSYRYAIAEVP